MRHRPLAIRALVGVVVAGLVVPDTGCLTAERRAGQYLNRVSVGMTQDEVREALGKADSIAGETWHYSYVSLPDPGKITVYTGRLLALLTLIGGCMLILAYGSRHGGGAQGPDFSPWFPSAGDSASSGTVHFRAVFDPAGRVSSISGIEECDD